MNDTQDEFESLRIYELKEKAIKQYAKDTGLNNASIDNSVVTGYGKTDIVIIYDKELNILAHYQHLEKDLFFRMDKK